MKTHKGAVRLFIVLFFYSAVQFVAIFSIAAEQAQDPTGGMASGGRDGLAKSSRPTVMQSAGAMISGGILNGFGNVNSEASAIETLEEICNLNAQSSMKSQEIFELFQISQKEIEIECKSLDRVENSSCEKLIQKVNHLYNCF